MGCWRDYNQVRVSSNRLLVLCALGLAALACMLASCAHADRRAVFAGDWRYATSCRFGHFVDMRIVQRGETLVGSWADGTRVRGWNGELQGVVRGGRAYLRSCTQDDADPRHACPNFAEDAGYLRRFGPRLAWYRPSYMTQPYVVLAPAGRAADQGHGEADCQDGG